MKQRQFISTVVAIVAIMPVYVGPTVAGEAWDAAKAIIVEHCIDCHEVPVYNPKGGPPSVEAPSFHGMAGAPETYPAERLRASLRQPHFPMQKFVLSERDVDVIVRFIESLR